MGKTVKCNSRSSDSITKACYVITIVSLFQINNFIICDSIFEERQKYTGSVSDSRFGMPVHSCSVQQKGMYSTSIDLEDIDPRNLKKCTQCRKYKRISSFISKRGRKLCLLCDACRNLFSVYRSRGRCSSVFTYRAEEGCANEQPANPTAVSG